MTGNGKKMTNKKAAPARAAEGKNVYRHFTTKEGLMWLITLGKLKKNPSTGRHCKNLETTRLKPYGITREDW